MSLIHWWPFDGDAVDRVQGKVFTTTNWQFETGGKIGQCFSPIWTDSNTISRQIYAEDVNIPETFSVAIWVKNENNFSSPRTYCPIQFSNGDCWLAGAANKGWDFSHNSLRLIFNNGSSVSGNAGNAEVSWGYNPKEFLGSWYHLAFTVNKTTRKAELFINGASKGVRDLPSALDTYGGTFKLKLNWVQGWMLDGAFNDLRIYDHALSKTEVKELSKALVVHYTFDDIFAETTINLVAPGVNSWGNLVGNITYTNNNGLYRLTSTTGGAIRLYFPLDILTNNTSYYFSCKYRKISGDGTFNLTDWCDGALVNYKIEDCGDFYLLSTKCNGRTYTSTYRFLDCSIAENSVVEIWDIQLQTNDKVTPYAIGTRNSMLHNEAGINQPSSITQLGLSEEFAVGKYSGVFNGSTYITHPTFGDGSEATASFWIKDFNTSGQMVVFADANSGLAFGPYSTYSCVSCRSGYNSQILTSVVNTYWKADDWNHVVVRKDKNNKYSCAINGNLIEPTTGDYWSHSTYCIVGARYSSGYGRQTVGKIDDFRLYYTYLSDNDIQLLYSSRGMISNKGDIMCGMISENEDYAGIGRKGTLDTTECYEEIDEAYERLEFLESTGTQYVDTGYITTSSDYSYEVDIIPTTKGSFYSYMGFMASGTTPRAGLHEYSGTFMLGANATTNSSVSPVIGQRVLLKARFKSGDQRLYKDGEQIASNSTSFNHSANTLSTYIFGRNYTSGRNLSKIKLYEAKIYEQDIVVRNYVPARRKSDGAPGLYEILTGDFIINIGSGTFKTGPTLTNGQVLISSTKKVGARNIIEV